MIASVSKNLLLLMTLFKIKTFRPLWMLQGLFLVSHCKKKRQIQDCVRSLEVWLSIGRLWRFIPWDIEIHSIIMIRLKIRHMQLVSESTNNGHVWSHGAIFSIYVRKLPPLRRQQSWTSFFSKPDTGSCIYKNYWVIIWAKKNKQSGFLQCHYFLFI